MHAEAVDAAFDELPSHLEQAGKLMRNKRMDWRNMAEQIIMEMAQLDGGLFKDGPVPESIGMKVCLGLLMHQASTLHGFNL